MKAPLKLQSCSFLAQSELLSMYRTLRPTQIARLSSASASSTARASRRLQLMPYSPYSPCSRASRSVFSTSSARRSATGENGRDTAAGETAERTQKTATAGGKPVYPERLIIYHPGTGRVTFIACLKVTTLFVFGFFDMIMTPAYIAASEPLLKTAGVALCGLIPAVYVAWSTSPFVASIHMHLPPYARWSRAILERFARTAPPNTRLDVTTMSLIGKPRVSSMVLGDLRPARERLGMVNYARDTAALDAKRPWWRFRAVGRFGVQEYPGVEKQVKTGWVWNVVREGIARRGGVGAEGGKGKG